MDRKYRLHRLIFLMWVFIACMSFTHIATAAPLAEFVSYTTEDKVLLNALLWMPPGGTKTVVIYVPGMTGGFIGVHEINPAAEGLTSKGYAFLAVNMRTAGLHGMLFARFEDYVKDIDAAIRFAKSRGLTEVVLYGVSLGGPRIMYYWAQTRDPSVRALVFMGCIKSPYLEAQLRWNESERARYDTFLQGARDRVAQGRGNEVLSYTDWFPKLTVTLSAQTFVNIFGTLAESNASTVKFGPQITIPAIIIHGLKDEIALPPNGQAIYDSLTAAPRREIVWVEDAGHYLIKGAVADKYAETLVTWLPKFIQPTR
jgi:pimeloyl-ACP methyl ester carboxylesterase